MPALPSIAGEFETRGVALAERVELLKWIAFAAMLVDHLRQFWHLDLPGGYLIGRAAFPLFALCFGWSLSVVGDCRRLFMRLLCAGLMAEVIGAWPVTHGLPLNVLFSFALCAFVVHRLRCGLTPSFGLFFQALCVWIASHFVEYGAAGVLLTLAAWYFWRAPGWSRAVALLAASVPLLIWNFTLWGTAWTAFGLLLLLLPVGVPRIARAFYVGYIAQWGVLWAFA